MNFELSVRDFCYYLEQGIILTESKYGELNGVKYRLDQGNAYSGQKTHVHIGDFTWNCDGTRSHRSRFDNKEPSKKIKSVAAQVLDISVAQLESYMDKTIIAKLNDIRLLTEAAKIFDDHVL